MTKYLVIETVQYEVEAEDPAQAVVSVGCGRLIHREVQEVDEPGPRDEDEPMEENY